MAPKQTEPKITALYERLSRDDEMAGDSGSIVNQKEYLESYAAEHGYSNCVHYTDDGWSGGNFDRPGWTRLAADIEAGKVGTVIAKDLSRIGRNYILTGYYTTTYAREYGVRFIAVANGFDSSNPATNEFAPFLNIINEWYLRDQSRKVKAFFRQRGMSGKPITNAPIYGYRRNPDDKFTWLIDEEAADVIRRIYKLCLEGMGPAIIARTLRDDKVESPGYYLATHERGSRKTTIDMSRPYDWYGETVATILSKPEYAGHTVNFRSSKETYDSKRVRNDPSKWMIFHNTHEAIVDQQTWDAVQEKRKTKRRVGMAGEVNPLTGQVFCADCGARMYNHHTSYTLADGTEKLSTYFNCSNYVLTNMREKPLCVGHYINCKAIEEMILRALRHVCKYARENEDAFIQQIRASSELKNAKEADRLQQVVNKARKRSAELDVLIKRLYESYATGKITEKRFELLCGEYESEQAELEETIAEAQAEVDNFHADTDRAEEFLALAKRYLEFPTLTPLMVTEFIDKVLVHAPVRTFDGTRTQKIQLYLKYIGEVEIPEPEKPLLSKEEMQKEKQRIRNHRKYARRKERKLLAQQEAERLAAEQAAAEDAEATTEPLGNAKPPADEHDTPDQPNITAEPA